jgi:hypothetical protein
LGQIQVDENEFKQSLIDSGFGMVKPYAFLLKYGSVFTETAPLPVGVRRIAGKCYANSGKLAGRSQGTYFYCEGVAISDGGGPIEHAWCVDSQRRVVEVTWKAPGDVYLGVVFRRKYLAELALQSRMWGGYVEEFAKQVCDGRASVYDGIFPGGMPK